MDRIVQADRTLPGPVGEVPTGSAVLVRGHKVGAVGPLDELRALAPTAEVETHPGCSITAGLVNSHVHLSADLSRRPFGAAEAGDRAAIATTIRMNALASLRGGCTTVRDLGDYSGLVFDYRDAVRRGEAVGPRIVAAGAPLTISGGHCWFLGGVADTEAEIVARIERLAARADVVKVMAGGGQMTPDGPSQWESQYTSRQLARVVEHARTHGLPVAAHAHATPTIIDCIDAGVTTIEHCGWRSGPGRNDRPTEAVRRMAEFGVVAGHTTPPQWRRMAERLEQDGGPRFGDQLVWMADHGVRQVVGTDSGMPNAVFDRFVDSLELYGELGFSNAEILEMVTATNARWLGLGDVTGRVAEGLDADLLVVEGNPLEDLAALRRLRRVVARGTVYRQDDLTESAS